MVIATGIFLFKLLNIGLKSHCEQLRMEKTELVLTNAELTREVQALKERVNHLEQRMRAVEKFFIMQGVPKEQLEQIIQIFPLFLKTESFCREVKI